MCEVQGNRWNKYSNESKFDLIWERGEADASGVHSAKTEERGEADASGTWRYATAGRRNAARTSRRALSRSQAQLKLAGTEDMFTLWLLSYHKALAANGMAVNLLYCN